MHFRNVQLFQDLRKLRPQSMERNDAHQDWQVHASRSTAGESDTCGREMGHLAAIRLPDT